MKLLWKETLRIFLKYSSYNLHLRIYNNKNWNGNKLFKNVC